MSPGELFQNNVCFVPFLYYWVSTLWVVSDVGLMTFASVDVFFNLAYFQRDSMSPGEGMWGPRFSDAVCPVPLSRHISYCIDFTYYKFLACSTGLFCRGFLIRESSSRLL